MAYNLSRVVRCGYYAENYLGFAQLASMPSCQDYFEKGSNRIDRDVQIRTPLALRPLYRSTRIR